ncbi:MAG: type I glutamate--ammonia ligase [Candidatus Hatepunaea meridiana]|nr:type I glutamate--ammonia ligase [Candidatus Hatepunaea meridiana]
MNVEQLIKFVHDKKIEVVDLKFCNLFGGLHHISLPVDMLNKELFNRGVGIDGSSIPGFKTEHTSDMMLIPDPATAVIDPFWERQSLSLIGSVFETETKEPFQLDPRQIIQKAERYLAETGVADRSIWGPEFEFNIFESVSIANSTHQASYRIESSEAGWNSKEGGQTNTGCQIPHQSGYQATPPNDKYFNLRDRMSAVIQDLGINVKYHHHEVGSSGQSEIEILLTPALQAGDAAMIIKYICRNIACQTGYCITFMPKPLYNEAGNGMHFHQHLFNGDKPVFYDVNGYAGLSETALNYVGGILKHGPALLAITNPSTNSYKRLIPGFEAPIKAIFGAGNRSAAIRIPKYANTPEKKRIEFRSPDGTCNVYLAIAAQLMAGIDGIVNKINPSDHGFGPYDINITELPQKEQDAIPSLPTSLEEAIEALEADHDFLLSGNVFSADFLNNWISKLKRDISEIRNRPHPYEMELYFDV